MRRASARWLPLAAAAAALACSQPEAPRDAATVQERAALVLEPPQLALGDVADLVLSVVTHPGARVDPPEPPAEVPGFEVLARETLPVEKDPTRWLHRTRLRLRAVQVGRFEFPGGTVRGESAEGAALEIPYAPLPLEVLSSLGEGGRRVPYGVRRLAAPRVGSVGAVLAFGAGAALALGGVGVAALVRRRLARRAPPPPPAPPTPPAWDVVLASLDAAEAARAADPRAALDAASRALRRYAAERYGADAPARSVEELAEATPPFLLTTRWSAFVALCASLDEARFAPRGRAERGALAQELLRRTRAFVEDTLPQEERG